MNVETTTPADGAGAGYTYPARVGAGGTVGYSVTCVDHGTAVSRGSTRVSTLHSRAGFRIVKGGVVLV